MVQLIALWGPPSDTEGFESHYAGVHLAAVQALPGLDRVDTGRAQSGPYYRVAVLHFPSMDVFGEAMGSESGAALMADTAHIQETYGASVDTLIVTPD